MAKGDALQPSANMLVFPGLDSSRLSHGAFNRHGGVSPTPWSTLNVSFGLGDDPQNVLENRARIKKNLGFASLVSARQVHGSCVEIVEESSGCDHTVDACDALVTNVRGLGLLIQQADCQAVLFFDPEKTAVAVAHVGWRGSVAGIIGKTVLAMIRAFETEPADLITAISPSLGPCCAEFVNYRSELPTSLHDYQVRPSYFDFWAISHDQLCKAGVKSKNIHTARICTCCNRDYFSYRRDRDTGRCASVIGIK